MKMEQAGFAEHKYRVGSLGDHLQQLVLQDEPVRREPTDSQQRGQHKRLMLIETELRDVSNSVEAMKMGPELDHFLLEQNEEQVSSLKRELADVSHDIATLDKDETGLAERRSAISKVIFNTCLQI